MAHNYDLSYTLLVTNLGHLSIRLYKIIILSFAFDILKIFLESEYFETM